MTASIDFDIVYSYDQFSVGLVVPVTISSGDVAAVFDAKIDTGSTYCVFQRLHGELIGLDIESGLEIEIGTPTGSFTAFGHEVSTHVLGIDTISTVYFAGSDLFDRNILGRIGWLDRLKFGLIEHDAAVYLSSY